MLVQPERDKYGLMFFNAKAEYQLSVQKDKSVVLRVDGEEFKIPEYTFLQTGGGRTLKARVSGGSGYRGSSPCPPANS